MAQQQPVDDTPQVFQVGDGLTIRSVAVSALKEQDINAQKMDPAKFERLVENIRQRGAVESIPYAHQPGGTGPITIISGHHRARAARAAGLTTIPVLVDTADMPRSLVAAKQIAHNELVGNPDALLLAQLVQRIDSPDDFLLSGLDAAPIPDVDLPRTTLALPQAKFDYRTVTIMFLPEQLDDFEDFLKTLPQTADTVGAAHLDQFPEFAKAVSTYMRVRNIKNMAAAITVLTQIANQQIAADE